MVALGLKIGATYLVGMGVIRTGATYLVRISAMRTGATYLVGVGAMTGVTYLVGVGVIRILGQTLGQGEHTGAPVHIEVLLSLGSALDFAGENILKQAERKRKHRFVQ